MTDASELQDDWNNGVNVLKATGLSDKTIVFFGCGDANGYSDTFCSGIAEP